MIADYDPIRKEYIENHLSYYQTLLLIYSQKVKQLKELEGIPDAR